MAYPSPRFRRTGVWSPEGYAALFSHANPQLSVIARRDLFRELWVVKLAALIGIADLRNGPQQSQVDHLQDEINLEPLAELPADYKTREPIQDNHQIESVALQTDKGDIETQ